MASLADRALILADDIGSKVAEETLDELKGESKRSWGLVVSAFVVGAAVAVVVIVLGLRRVAENVRRPDEEILEDPATGVVPDSPTRSRAPWAKNARGGLSAVFRLPARS